MKKECDALGPGLSEIVCTELLEYLLLKKK